MEKILSYDVAVILRITACQKIRMTTYVIAFSNVHEMPLQTTVSAIVFLLKKKYFEGDKIPFVKSLLINRLFLGYFI